MAKTYRNLYGRMTDLENIKAATLAAARGKRRKRAVRRALADLDAWALQIRSLLTTGAWQPEEVRHGFTIYDGLRKKERVIIHPNFTEQVIHHLLVDFILVPIFQPSFYRWSCGSIPGRGQEEMVTYIKYKLRREGRKAKYWSVLDIRKCFDTIDTEACYAAIAKRVKDERVMAIVRKVLDSNRILLPDGTMREGGVPIGLYTSPWFVNIAPTRLDHFIKDDSATFVYMRFIDDMLMLHANKREMRRVIARVGAMLSDMGMAFKRVVMPRRFRWGREGKMRFTGFQFERSGRTVIRDAIYLRAVRCGARLRRKAAGGRRITAYDAAKMISYGGRFRAFGSYNAFPTKVLCGKIRYFSLRQKIADRDRRRAMAEKLKLIEATKGAA